MSYSVDHKFTDNKGREINFEVANDIIAHVQGKEIGYVQFDFDDFTYHPYLFHMSVESSYSRAGIGAEMIRLAAEVHGRRFGRPSFLAQGGSGKSSSDYFTQDIEDYIEADYTPAPPPPAPAPTITVTEPIDVPDEPEHAMTYETACAVTNRDGERYGDIPTDKLSFMLRSIEKRIRENHLEPDEKDALEMKRDAIIVIIRHRREVGE